MLLRIQPNSDIPIYRQLIRQIQHAVATRRLHAGDAMPSGRAIAKDLGVNPATVVRAYNELERLGVLETRRGRGTFVAAGPTSLAVDARRKLISGTADQLMAEAIALSLSRDDAHAAVDAAADNIERERDTAKDEEGRRDE